jgi:hypothetical protein
MIQQPEQKNEAIYYLFQCGKAAEGRGKRTEGKVPPCGAWNIRKSKTRLTSKRQLQGNCKCGRRPRIDPSNTVVYLTRLEALTEADKRNKASIRDKTAIVQQEWLL